MQLKVISLVLSYLSIVSPHFLHFKSVSNINPFITFVVFQLLYRCVQAINMSHDAVHAQMDVKLRSLICLGLNEQVIRVHRMLIIYNTVFL